MGRLSPPRCCVLRDRLVPEELTSRAGIPCSRPVRAVFDEARAAADVREAAVALALASEDSRSPNETRLRLMWELDARLPRPLVNQPVFDLRGKLLGIADLLDPVTGLVGECDGADHRSAGRHSGDVDRESRMRDAGLEVVRVTGPDLLHRTLVVERIEAAQARARRLAPDRRLWTIEPPSDRPVELPLHDRLQQIAEWERWEREQARAM